MLAQGPVGRRRPKRTSAPLRRLAAGWIAAGLIAGCGPPVVDNRLDWCRRHGDELQELGKGLGVDYSALNGAAMDQVPPDGNQQQRELAYWAAMEANPTYRALCDEATIRRHGAENWTAPPAPARTSPPGGRP